MTGETVPGVGIWGAPLIVGGLGSPVCCDGYLGSVCTCDPAAGSCSCSGGTTGGAKAAAIPATLTPDCCYILGGPGLGGGTGGTVPPGPCCDVIVWRTCDAQVARVSICGNKATVVTLGPVGIGSIPGIGAQGYFLANGMTYSFAVAPGQPAGCNTVALATPGYGTQIAAAFPPCGGSVVFGNAVQVGGGVPPGPQMHCQPGWHPWYDPLTGALIGCQPNTGNNQNIIPITGQDALWRTPLGGEGLGGVGPDAAIDAGQITSATAGIPKIATAGASVTMITIPADATKVLLGDGTFGAVPGGGGSGGGTTTTATLTTTDATVTTIQTIACADNTLTFIDVTIRGIQTAGAGAGNGFGYKKVFVYKRWSAGAPAAVTGHTSAQDLYYDSTAFSPPAVNVTTSGNNVLIQVNGEAGLTYHWNSDVTVYTAN